MSLVENIKRRRVSLKTNKGKNINNKRKMEGKNIFFGILKDGKVVEFNDENAFNDASNNPLNIYLLRGDWKRTTEKNFKIFRYSLFSKSEIVENRILKWGNIECELPETDIWDSIHGGSHNGVTFKVVINKIFILTFYSEKHSIDMIKELMNFLIFLKSHNAIIKDFATI